MMVEILFNYIQKIFYKYIDSNKYINGQTFSNK